jgi:hypothetical protein
LIELKSNTSGRATHRAATAPHAGMIGAPGVRTGRHLQDHAAPDRDR